MEGAEGGGHDVTGEDGCQEQRGGTGTATNGGREREETTGTRKRKGHKIVYLPNNVKYIQQFKTKILQTHTCIKQIYCFNQFCCNIPAKNFYEPIKI